MYSTPSISIVWSRNEAHSAQLILRLKKGAGLFKSPTQDILEQKGLLRRSKELKKESIAQKGLDFVEKFRKKKSSKFENVAQFLEQRSNWKQSVTIN